MTTRERDEDAMSLFPSDTVELTAAGQGRRDAMLPLLLGVQRERVRRRRTGRAAAVFAVVALGGSAAYVGATRGTAGGASRIAGTTVRDAEGSTASGSTILTTSLVHADASILDRVVFRGSAGAAVVDDAQLAELLREAGREAGIVRIGGRTVLASELAPSSATGGPTEPSGRADDRGGSAAG
ncbi:MAG: hypothetical protein ACKVU4_12105 [Phycisphaerales bacterium]